MNLKVFRILLFRHFCQEQFLNDLLLLHICYEINNFFKNLLLYRFFRKVIVNIKTNELIQQKKL